MHRIALSLAFIGVSAGLMVMGCGTDTTNQTSTGTPTKAVPLENASAEMAKVICGIIFSCCDAAEQTKVFNKLMPLPTNQAECETAYKPIADSEIFGKLKEGVAAGRLAYDADQAGLCFAAIDGQCSSFKDDVFGEEVCEPVFTAKVADGGDCLQSLECAQAGSACAGVMDAAPGKCTPLPKENAPCPDFACAEGLVCAFDTTPICVKPKADAMTCGSDYECISGYCEYPSMKCTAQKAIGEMCTSPYACKDSFCDDGTTVCTAKKAIGVACVNFEECVTGECDSDTNLCAAPTCDGK